MVDDIKGYILFLISIYGADILYNYGCKNKAVIFFVINALYLFIYFVNFS